MSVKRYQFTLTTLLQYVFGQTKKQRSSSKRPTENDLEAWSVYWKTQGQLWRTEPEIDEQRQEYLAQRLSIRPDIEQGTYPFKNIQLNRADVEWLLVTHEGGRGPVNWNDGQQSEQREGLDLRGADLRQVDLQRLPLTRLLGGLTWVEWLAASDKQREMAGVQMEKANLFRTHLEGARLRRAHLEGARLSLAHLEKAYLDEAYLEGAVLHRTHLEGTELRETHLERVILREAFFDNATRLDGVKLGNGKHGFVSLADVSWNGVNLAVVDWSQMNMLGDEWQAHQWKASKGQKTRRERANEKKAQYDQYWIAVRSTRQLAIVLQGQGLNEYARRFAYRAQLLRRKILWLQLGLPQVNFWWRGKKLGYYLASLFFDLIAGYGYKPLRSVITYLILVGLFAVAYFILGMVASVPRHLEWYEAVVVSLTAFHGRGFFSEQFKPGDPQTFIAAIEAVVGLLIEVSFIATFTRRFFEE